MTHARASCLVVEDQESLRRALLRVLGGEGYACREAASGVEAVAALESEPAELVLSDLRMPRMDGVTLLRTIRDRWPDTAVVMVTAVADVETAVSCLQLGAMDYITKPFEINEVRARVAQALDKRRLILDNRRYQLHLADLVQQQASRIEELFLEGVQTLVEALEAKDPYTRGHSARVSAYAGGTARALRLGRTDIELIELGAELHDIGKIGVQEAVLRKPGRLTDEEYRHLMQHTAIGARILEPLLRRAPQVLAVVRSHHERVDGSGLPDGLRRDAIAIHARVVSVCDAFDAMTSGRPYRAPLSVQEATAELERMQGRQFDPDVVRAFLSAYPDPADIPIPTPAKVRRRVPGGIAAVGVPTE